MASLDRPVVRPELRHGNFNVVLPGLFAGITVVQPWSRAGAAGREGYRVMAEYVLMQLNQLLQPDAAAFTPALGSADFVRFRQPGRP